jgi:hypothetical protein
MIVLLIYQIKIVNLSSQYQLEFNKYEKVNYSDN